MAGYVDMYQEERKIGKQTSLALKTYLKTVIGSTTKTRSGNALRSAGSRAVYKQQRLQRVTLQAEHYIFKQNYGFEGKKKNGVNMRLRATEVIDKVLNDSNIIDNLANAISNLRAEEVESLIRLR